jgi:Tfp pilus assembly protein PilF
MRRAIELNPQYADAHFNLAVMYAKQKVPRPELSRYHYQKSLDLGAPPDPQLEELLKKLTEKPAETNSTAKPAEPVSTAAPSKP